MLASDQCQGKAQGVVNAGGGVETEPDEGRGSPEPDAIVAAIVVYAVRANAEDDEREGRSGGEQGGGVPVVEAAALARI